LARLVFIHTILVKMSTATPEPIQLVEALPVSCHSFNADRTQVAISPNNNIVEIFEKVNPSSVIARNSKLKGWVKIHELKEHDQRITSIDWAPKTNLIVTCAEDRNAYVWKLTSENTWKPGLVVLRINRAATCVKWSPDEKKFAIGSGARIVSVCYFQEENDWWVAKHIKSGIRSTVTSVAWHSQSTMLAVGCSDFCARIYSAAIKGVDSKPEANVWAEKPKSFGNVLHEYYGVSDGWVHDVAFSPSGHKFAWVSHSSSISLVDATQDPTKHTSLFEKSLPKRAIEFLDDESVIAAGHDNVPCLYKQNGAALVFDSVLDQPQKVESSGVTSAMNRFKQMDMASQTKKDTKLNSTHQNAINQISKYEESNGTVTKFATSGQDGKLVIWTMN